MALNNQVLCDVIEWGAGLEGFSAGHAIDAMILAQGYVEGFEDGQGRRVRGVGAWDDDNVRLLAMDIAWLFWLDDRYDSGAMAAPRRPLRALTEPGFLRLLPAFARATSDEASLSLWIDEADFVMYGYGEDHLFSRGDRSWTYAEYIENGEASVGVRHCMATISLLFGHDMAARAKEARFQRMLRHLCLAMRLQNDLISAGKERAEGDRANAVFFMEALTSRADAIAFIAEQQRGYERLLARDIEALGPGDPFGRIAEVMLAMTARFYSLSRERYAVKRPPPPPPPGEAPVPAQG